MPWVATFKEGYGEMHVSRYRPNSQNLEESLTADRCAGMERFRDLRVHSDLEVIFDCQFLIAVLDLGLNPICKGLPDYAVDHVAQPLPINAGQVLRIRQISGDLGVALGLC